MKKALNFKFMNGTLCIVGITLFLLSLCQFLYYLFIKRLILILKDKMNHDIFLEKMKEEKDLVETQNKIYEIHCNYILSKADDLLKEEMKKLEKFD